MKLMVDDGPGCKKFLWASRHRLLEREVAALRDMLGCVRVYWVRGVTSADELASMAERFDAVGGTLPLSLIRAFLKRSGKPFFFPQMRDARPGEQADYVVPRTGEAKVFDGWRRLREVRLVFD